MEARAHGLELELTRANSERDVQRATAEQKAKEAELQVAALRENVEALAVRAPRSQHQEAAIEALTNTLVQKDALLEVLGDALRSAETALEERGPLCRRSCNRSTLHGQSWMRRGGASRVHIEIGFS